MYSIKLLLTYSKKGEMFRDKLAPGVYATITTNKIMDDDAEILDLSGASKYLPESYIPHLTVRLINPTLGQVFEKIRERFNSVPVSTDGDVVVTIGNKDVDIFEDVIPRNDYIKMKDEDLVRNYKNLINQHLPYLTG